MHPEDNKDYVKNSLIFLILAFLLIFGWNFIFPSEPPKEDAAQNSEAVTKTAAPTGADPGALAAPSADEQPAKKARTLVVTTDNYLIKIDEATGDINYLELLRQKDDDKDQSNKVLFNEKNHYLAQSRLIDGNNRFFLEGTPYKAQKTHYELGGENELKVTLTKETGEARLEKSFIFKKNSYLIDFAYVVTNKGAAPLALTAMYRLLHDSTEEKKSNFLTSFYSGPVLYTAETKFKKIPYADIAKGDVEIPATATSGWLGMTQHYFSSVFILEPKNGASVCAPAGCRLFINQRPADRLFEVAFTTQLPAVAAGKSQSLKVNLFSGPQESQELAKIADNLALLKDYGIFRIFANPLFVTLQFIENYTGNWGWAIILLVILLKVIFYPLNATSARSMAQMRNIAPKMKKLQETYADDKPKLQKEVMELYKKEKVNPLAGCLPMLVQFPIFIGLYWAIFNSVELRGAPWLGWITDLSKLDPYFILPILMSLTMILQSFVNPPPADPMQARLMKIIPLVFSIMFFFFPAGLVLYWIVNNILTILQQLRFNRKYVHTGAH